MYKLGICHTSVNQIGFYIKNYSPTIQKLLPYVSSEKCSSDDTTVFITAKKKSKGKQTHKQKLSQSQLCPLIMSLDSCPVIKNY